MSRTGSRVAAALVTVLMTLMLFGFGPGSPTARASSASATISDLDAIIEAIQRLRAEKKEGLLTPDGVKERAQEIEQMKYELMDNDLPRICGTLFRKIYDLLNEIDHAQRKAADRAGHYYADAQEKKSAEKLKEDLRELRRSLEKVVDAWEALRGKLADCPAARDVIEERIKEVRKLIRDVDPDDPKLTPLGVERAVDRIYRDAYNGLLKVLKDIFGVPFSKVFFGLDTLDGYLSSGSLSVAEDAAKDLRDAFLAKNPSPTPSTSPSATTT